MAYSGSPGGGYGDLSSLRSEGREPGARRKKIAGYLKAANDLRQSYFSQYGDDYSARDGLGESGVEGPGGFPEAAVVRSGNEEMILFPSYARRHVKRKTAPPPVPSDVSEQEYWRREFDRHQDDNAVVDVDVRGWIYTPHRGQTTRKQRLMIGLARQLAGLPAPAPTTNRLTESSLSSQASSRTSSPYYDKQEEDLIAREAENIVRKGEYEQRYARRGAFSEAPGHGRDDDSVYNYSSQTSSREPSPDRGRNRLSHISTTSSTDGDSESITTPQKRTSWQQQPTKMTAAELAIANNHLLNRIKPFMHNPLANSPISCFFYNESSSRQHTVYTNPSGHFSCRAPLDFVPTHVRVLAGEKLSATEEVTITSPKGVSLISDIDDTVKHSEVGAGARQIFRNAFTKELDGLTIDGVKEWYNTMHDMGVQLHYVSNSPWQMYPVLTSFFKLANLPRGSFHLKQYSGYLQGIFEPVAERKKSSLERIMTDFPNRKFILVGDSGEADLEVYTDIALDFPGRVLGIFIRDVTTPVQTGYFDPSNGMTSGGHYTPRQPTRGKTSDSLAQSKKLARPNDIRDDDAELKAAIAASLADMEEETRRVKKSINPDSPSPENAETPKPRPGVPLRRSVSNITELPGTASPEEDLIDFSDDPAPSQRWLAPPTRSSTSPKLSQANGGSQLKPTPSPPPKPQALRSPSPSGQRQTGPPESSRKTPPPRPRKPSSAVKAPSPQQIQTWSARPTPPQHTQSQTHQPSPLSQVTQQSPEAKQKPPLPVRRKQESMVLQGLASTHKAFAPATYWQSDAAVGQPRSTISNAETPRAMSTASTISAESLRPSSSSTVKPHPPPPPPRLRNVTSFTTTAARKATNRLSGGWDDASGGSLPGSPGEAGMGRKEFLWNQRWARAKAILDRQGVTLRSWRIGADVADVCVKLAEQAFREIEKENKSKGQ